MFSKRNRKKESIKTSKQKGGIKSQKPDRQTVRQSDR